MRSLENIFLLKADKLKLITALMSGMLMGFTVAPVGAWFLAWIALAPLWVLIISPTHLKTKTLSSPSSPSSPPSPAVLALFWGIAYHGVALSWITGIHPMTWMGVPWLASLAIALFCWVFITLWGAVLVVVWATAMRVANIQNPFLRVLVGTAIWCGLESLWSQGPLDWTYLAYTQSPHNLVILHLGQLSGPSAVTAGLVAVNGFIAEAWINRCANKYLAIATTLLVTLHLIGFGLYTRPLVQTPTSELKVGIIQGNVPNEIKLYPEGFRRAIEGYTSGYLSLANQGVDAVLTPEGALPFFQDKIIQSSLVAAVREKAVVAWIGGFYTQGQGDGYTNSLFTFGGDGEIKSHYGKVKMVPIGEYIPFEPILGAIVKRLSPLDEHQIAGPPNQVFDTPFGRAIVGICYESTFAEQFRRQAAAGGQFILSPSNDAHFSPVMPAQHHAQDIMRAIENDRWAVRATNTGYSAFVDPHGRTLWISGYNTYEVHAETIYRRQTQTLYVRWGDWLMPLLLVFGALAWGLNVFWWNEAQY